MSTVSRARRRQPAPSVYDPVAIGEAVAARVASVREADEPIDYLSIVPDGEPTLDCSLGETIDRLKRLGIDVAVITTASLLYRENVQADLSRADYVLAKIDVGDAET